MDEPEVALLKRETDSEECLYKVEEHLVSRTFRFSVTSDYCFEKLSASVRMPSGKRDVAHIKVNFEIFMLIQNCLLNFSGNKPKS